MVNKLDILEMVLDNTQAPENYSELGILRFGKIFFEEQFCDNYAPLHYNMSQLLFQLWNPTRERRIERQAYFIVHREAAKSSIGSFLFPLYAIFLKGHRPWVRFYKEGWQGGTGIDKYDMVELPPIKEDFIVIASETASSAENFLVDIKSVIQMSQELSDVFGEKHPEMIELDDEERRGDEMWRKNAFITSDETVVVGIGSGQQIRGRKIRGKRPSLIIVDDMYSRRNTKTELNREHLNYWFFSELLKSADTINGKILWLGTQVHPDTVPTKLSKSDEWFGMKRPIISEPELARALKLCTKGEDFRIPGKYTLAKEEKSYKTLSWPERHNLFSILSTFKEARDNNDLNYFYQEYMNMIKDPKNNILAPDSFLQVPQKFSKKNKQQLVAFEFRNKTWEGTANLHIGVDIASSLADSADDTVIFVAGYSRTYPKIVGMDVLSAMRSIPGGMVMPVIAHVEGGKYDVHAYQGREGICERILALVRMYNIQKVVIEAQGQQALIVREVRRYLRDQGIIISVVEEYVNTEKGERITAVLLPIIQTYKHILCPVNPLIDKTFTQLQLIGIADHDDYPDALEECFKYVKAPRAEEFTAFTDNSQRQKTRQEMLEDIYGENAWYHG